MELILTPEEEQRLDAVCDEFDPATHPLTQPYFDGLEAEEEKDFVIEFHQESLRRRLWGALLLNALSTHEMVNGTREDIIIDELEHNDPMSRVTLPNGELSPFIRNFIGDTIGGYSSMKQFVCNSILQKVNQGKGRAVGEAQERFFELVELAVFRLFPEWWEMRAAREREYAQELADA